MKFYNTITTAIFENRLLSSEADKVSQKYEFVIKCRSRQERSSRLPVGKKFSQQLKGD